MATAEVSHPQGISSATFYKWKSKFGGLEVEARFVLAAWRHAYNTVRPHSKLGGKTPADIADKRVKQP